MCNCVLLVLVVFVVVVLVWFLLRVLFCAACLLIFFLSFPRDHVEPVLWWYTGGCFTCYLVGLCVWRGAGDRGVGVWGGGLCGRRKVGLFGFTD